jgi:HEAT repeat protein
MPSGIIDMRARYLWPLWLLLCVGGCGKSTADWGEQLKSPDPRVRLHAVHALQERAGERETVVPLLVEALKDEDVYVRRDAARALEQIDPPAREAVPGLVLLLKDGEPSVRRAAARALKKIDPEAVEKGGGAKR